MRTISPRILVILLALSCAVIQTRAQEPSAADRPRAFQITPATETSLRDRPTRFIPSWFPEKGTTTFSLIDPAKIGPLPPGYVAHNNIAYDLKSDTEWGTPVIIEFSLPTVTDRAVFDGLRIFHGEWDSVDGKFLWADCTILEAGKWAPDFGNRVLRASVEEGRKTVFMPNQFGPFVVARLVEPQSPANAVADLMVEVEGPATGTGNKPLNYQIKVTNRGPQTATNLQLWAAGFSSREYTDSTPPQGGRCKPDGSNLLCRLDALAKGESVVFKLVTTPWEGNSRFSEEGELKHATATVWATEKDSNPQNNQTITETRVFRDPNAPPTVEFVSHKTFDYITKAEEISFTAEAKDSDGTISSVEFEIDGKPLEAGIPVGNNRYSFNWKNPSSGHHSVFVYVKDDKGRANYTWINVTVNGTAQINIIHPKQNGAVNFPLPPAPATIDVVAEVTDPRAKIAKVEFSMYPVDNNKPVEAKLAGANLYRASFPATYTGPYTLTVVVTDEHGVTTTVPEVWFVVSPPGEVSVKVARKSRGAFKAPARITLEAMPTDGPAILVAAIVTRVDFYANGKLIGSDVMKNPPISPAFSIDRPFRFIWENVPAGTYKITAIATNSGGTVSQASPPVKVTVRPR